MNFVLLRFLLYKFDFFPVIHITKHPNYLFTKTMSTMFLFYNRVISYNSCLEFSTTQGGCKLLISLYKKHKSSQRRLYRLRSMGIQKIYKYVFTKKYYPISTRKTTDLANGSVCIPWPHIFLLIFRLCFWRKRSCFAC